MYVDPGIGVVTHLPRHADGGFGCIHSQCVSSYEAFTTHRSYVNFILGPHFLHARSSLLEVRV